MKRGYLILLVIFFALLGGSRWWTHLRSLPRDTEQRTTSLDDSSPSSHGPVFTSKNIGAQSNSTSNPDSLKKTSGQASRSEEDWKRIIEGKNVPISFWGMVVDQSNQPISNVKVTVSIRQWSVTQPFGAGSVHPTRTLLTDAQGKFEITHETGDVLEIAKVEKSGYKLSPKAPRSFSYGDSPEPFSPDIAQPVIIRMWRMGASESIISHDSFWGLIPDGRIYTIDLIKDVKHEGEAFGDILLKIIRPPNVSPTDKYQWNFQISAINGGLQEASDEFLLEAPSDGYAPVVNVTFQTNNTWTSVFKKSYYFTSRGGQVYGAIQITVRPKYSDTSALQIHSVVNPNGSRSLEQ